jgi:hypothetical protein
MLTDGEKPAPVSFCAHKPHMDCLGIEPSLPKREVGKLFAQGMAWQNVNATLFVKEKGELGTHGTL